MSVDVLPSSLCQAPKNVQRSPYGNTAPVYCFHCHREWGRVVPEMMTFAAVLCNDCVATHGHIANMYAEPDHVFWERHRQATEDMQRVSSLDVSTPEGLARALDDPSSPLAKVARDWQTAFEKGSLR